VERLAAAGVGVSVAATPLMAMQNPDAFARRARESGAAGAWAGALRLLKDDPFLDLLARNGWLHVLDPDYQEQVREALRRAFPAGTDGRRRRRPAAGAGGCVPKSPVPARPPGFAAALQPALFDAL
jgi:hypothetical protein